MLKRMRNTKCTVFNLEFTMYNVKLILFPSCIHKPHNPVYAVGTGLAPVLNKCYNKPINPMYVVGTGLAPVLNAPCRSSKFPLSL
jgi:hypothetical protein